MMNEADEENNREGERRQWQTAENKIRCIYGRVK